MLLLKKCLNSLYFKINYPKKITTHLLNPNCYIMIFITSHKCCSVGIPRESNPIYKRQSILMGLLRS